MILERLTKNNSGGWGLIWFIDSDNTKLNAKVNNVRARLYNNNNRCCRKRGRRPANYTASHTTNARSSKVESKVTSQRTCLTQICMPAGLSCCLQIEIIED